MPYNAYIDLASWKGTAAMNVTIGTAYDTRLRLLIEDVSRQIDRYCNRHFYYYVGTLTFSGDGSRLLLVPDLISVGTIQEDDNHDGSFDTNWVANDFFLYPRNANPTGTWDARPYSRILVSDKSNGTQDIFVKGDSNYQIVGTWGYSKVTRGIVATGTLANATATNLVLQASATGTIEIGMTLLLADELVYVTATTGTSATVVRAINGSTGTVHTARTISVIDYPGPVVEACLVQSARLWRRKDSAFASEVGFPETGAMMTWRGGLDADIKALLASYRRIVI